MVLKEDDDVLPADIDKVIVKKAGGFPEISPKKGDEVHVRYTGFSVSDDAAFASGTLEFRLGRDGAMEGLDRVVATMKKGEVSAFTIPEMYLNGGCQDLQDQLPEDADTVRFELELLAVKPITDLFRDGGAMMTIEQQDDLYGKQPKQEDEMAITFQVGLRGSASSFGPPTTLDYRIGHGLGANAAFQTRVLDKALLSMRRKWEVSLELSSDYASIENVCADEGVPAKADAAVIVKLTLDEIYETEDVGKKLSLAQGILVKKAIRVVNRGLVPGLDGTRCQVKLLSAKREGCNAELLSEIDETLEFVPGNGILCDALELGCARMKSGELAVISARGPSLLSPGRPSLLADAQEASNVDAASCIQFRVEMLDFDRPPPEDGPSSDAERLRFCAAQKERGTDHFRTGRWRLAQERYSRVLDLLPRYKREHDSHINVEMFAYEEDRRRAQELRIACRMNLAACALKLEEFYAAVRYCEAVLKDEPRNTKSLYRRAQAHLGTKDFDLATADCKKLLELDAENRDAKLLLRSVAQLRKEESSRQRAQFGGKF
eukprot:TRINITY_DN18009_c1_g4_i1.p1 TRINITY_DN18009_c1_g4~~TRINITY_DN18009_c1_g4_i1.p1  ORF type:complete len:547 (+),score=145.63 TRINITY_DN18009_c1_g4_i1:59-1699(+)